MWEEDNEGRVPSQRAVTGSVPSPLLDGGLEHPRPRHGFTLVNINNWQGALASAPLSHLGFHAPLLLTNNAAKLPSEVENYYKMVAPTYLTTPADGPYNMTYVLGN